MKQKNGSRNTSVVNEDVDTKSSRFLHDATVQRRHRGLAVYLYDVLCQQQQQVSYSSHVDTLMQQPIPEVDRYSAS